MTPSKKAEKATYRPFPNVAAGAFTRSIGGDMSTPMQPNPISHVLSRHIQIDWLALFLISHLPRIFVPSRLISLLYFNLRFCLSILSFFLFFFFEKVSILFLIMNLRQDTFCNFLKNTISSNKFIIIIF